MIAWSREVDPDARIGLNIVMTDGERMVGTRFGRTLWTLTREQAQTCPHCGKTHVHQEVGAEYRVVEIASEPITDERWEEVPDGSVYSVDEDFYLLAERAL